MNIRRPWLALALLFVFSAAVGFAIPTTLAYITAQSDTLVNTFTAPYYAPESAGVDVQVNKVVRSKGAQSISPEGFQFCLLDEQTGESVILTADAQGHASAALRFTDADLGRTHAYTLYEINDARPGVAYSDKVYAVEIELNVDAENRIAASVRVDGKAVQWIEAEFVNVYSAGSIFLPTTGDDSRLGLYTMLMLAGAAG